HTVTDHGVLTHERQTSRRVPHTLRRLSVSLPVGADQTIRVHGLLGPAPLRAGRTQPQYRAYTRLRAPHQCPPSSRSVRGSSFQGCPEERRKPTVSVATSYLPGARLGCVRWTWPEELWGGSTWCRSWTGPRTPCGVTRTWPWTSTGKRDSATRPWTTWYAPTNATRTATAPSWRALSPITRPCRSFRCSPWPLRWSVSWRHGTWS